MIIFRDPTFNLNDFIRTLRLELKSWRKVFWRLWGICHALYCSLCGSYFQVYMHEFCSFHPQDPEFPNIQFKNSTQPCGTYPCCQVAVNRFSPLPPSDKVLIKYIWNHTEFLISIHNYNDINVEMNNFNNFSGMPVTWSSSESQKQNGNKWGRDATTTRNISIIDGSSWFDLFMPNS